MGAGLLEGIAGYAEASGKQCAALHGLGHPDGVLNAIVLKGFQHVVVIVVGDGNVQSQLVQQILADDVAARLNIIVVIAVHKEHLTVIVVSVPVVLLILLNVGHIVGSVFLHQVGEVDDHVVLIALHRAAGIALVKAGDDVGIILRSHHQVELLIGGHHVLLQQLQGDVGLFGDILHNRRAHHGKASGRCSTPHTERGHLIGDGKIYGLRQLEFHGFLHLRFLRRTGLGFLG